MADAFTLTIKTGAIRRTAERAHFSSRKLIAARLDDIDAAVAAGSTLSEIRTMIIEMRGWAWFGPLREWTWLDNRLDELAEYLTTPEETRSLRELAAELERSILAHHGAGV